MAMIPDDASVSAASMFVPHLALRENIQNYANAKGTVKADYILITEHYVNFLYYGKLAFTNRSDYETMASDGAIHLLKRKTP